MKTRRASRSASRHARRILRNTRGRFRSKQPRNTRGRYTFRNKRRN